MDVHQAEFVLSAARPGDYPPPDLPEVCFAGRSNVGKSSLLNVLLGRRRLVKVSSRPGKTRLINFFRVDDAWSLVDLPGYGYAAVSRTERRAFGERVEAYLRTRTSLRACVLLLDVRHPPREEECLFLESLSAWDVRLGAWRELDRGQDAGDVPATLGWDEDGADEAGRLLLPSDGRLHLALQPLAGLGNGTGDARVQVDWVELRVRYRWPAQ